MRKNRTKHEAKKPRLAKRALALCFALIFVCSCLLPAFANSEMGALAGTQETVVEPQQDEQPTDPVLLNEGGTDSAVDNTDSTGNDTNPTGSGTNPTEEPKPTEQEPEADEPKNEEPKTEETKNEGTTGETKPEEQTKPEGTTGETEGNEQKSEPKPGETKPEETKPEGTTEEPKPEEQPKPAESKPTTNTTGDTIEQGKATYTYRFWPDKIDAFELEAINADVKSGTSLKDAAQSRAGMVPCTVLTVMTNANLRDYQANVQQPTKSGYEFAGWYTVDGTTEDEFSFEQSLNFEKSQTIDVFAKWNELKAVKSDALSNGGMTVEAKVGPMANVKSVALAEPSQSDAETLRNSIDKQLYDQSYMVAIFDITPKDKDGMDVEPQNGESVNVEISGLDFSAGDNVWVYHLTNSGRVETLSATVTSDGGVAFAAKSFSPFAVVKLTEGMVGFGTEDDRLATAGWSDSYEMKVGDTNTLYGSGRYYGNHKWGSNRPDVVTVTGNDYFATVEAKSKGPAVVTHTYGPSSTRYDRFTINVKEDTTPYPQYVYLYTKIDSDVNKKLGLTQNADGWFTVGYIEMSNFLKPTSSRQNPKWKDESPYYLQVVDALNEASVTRFGKNSHVHLSNIDWNHADVTDYNTHTTEQFGLVSANGATDYNDEHNIPLESNHQYAKRWYLDGYIDSIGAVRVNYYIKGTNTSLQKSVEHLGTPGETFTLTDAPEELRDAEGLTYKRYSYDPANSVVFPENSTKEINVYYVRNTLDVTIVKKVEDGDHTRYFDFKVTGSSVGTKLITGPDGETLENHNQFFKMRDDGKGAVVHGLKKDDIFTVRESIYEVGEDGKEAKVNGVVGYDTKATGYNYVLAGGTGKNFTYQVVEDTATGELVLQPIKDSAGPAPSDTSYISDGRIVVTNNLALTNLTVEKTVVGKNGATPPENATFTFTLEVDDHKDYRTNVAIAAQDDGVTVEPLQDNKWKITLKNGKSATFSGIRIDDENVTVTETDPGADYTTTYQINNGSSQDGTSAKISSSILKANKQNGTTVKFTNTYTLQKLESITITKVVTGEFGDRDKSFAFSVKLTDKGGKEITGEFHTSENGANVTRLDAFTLKHGQLVTLENIPIDTTITITESNANDYDTKATNYDKADNKTFVYEVVNENGTAVLKSRDNRQTVADNAIVVTNRFDGNPDTGVLLDTLPYLILLAVAVAGGVLVVVRKRKHRDE